MGSRIGYRCTFEGSESPILRMQWQTNLENLVQKTWNKLLSVPSFDDKYKKTGYEIGKIGAGDVALRDDLSEDRGFAALVAANYEPPFHSVHTAETCDIYDNGLISIDVTKWNEWIIYHQSLSYTTKKLSRRRKVAKISEAGFLWLIKEESRKKIGEGLF